MTLADFKAPLKRIIREMSNTEPLKNIGSAIARWTLVHVTKSSSAYI